jgi:hypothetical protein
MTIHWKDRGGAFSDGSFSIQYFREKKMLFKKFSQKPQCVSLNYIEQAYFISKDFMWLNSKQVNF